jgi:hypothetical protein
MTAPAVFTKAELTRALKAANDAGVEMRLVKERDGTLAMVFAKPGKVTNRPNSWDALVE